MENLIATINELQDVLATVKSSEAIQLPQIAVVGGQSSGKSSVLETIVGRDFLPRGTGIVTRAPLILQLVNLKQKKANPKPKKSPAKNAPAWNNIYGRLSEINSSIVSTINPLSNAPDEQADWAEFLHLKDRKFTDFEEVRNEIEAETDRRTGGTKKICSEPIRLRIYSAKVVNLTLVDLPGLTKVPVPGQPEDIEAQVRNLIVEYIKNPNSIILAVTAANTDLATSEGLKLAKDFDPDGKRTLAVLTKLDLMDAGTNANDVLRGKVIPVKLGIIGIVNRSQQDINDQKSIKDAQEYEVSYLTQNYPDLDQQNGSAFLVRRLSEILLKHIMQTLPDLRNRVNKLAFEYREKLKSYGETLEPNQKGPKLLHIVKSFSTLFQSTIEGTVSIERNTLCGGAKICEVLIDKLSRELDSINALDGLKDKEIRFSIKNATGMVPALNVPQRAFELLVKEQLKKLEEPCTGCADWVIYEMDTILEQCQLKIERDLCHYPNLSREMLDIAKNLLNDKLPETKKVISDLLSAQLSYINVKNEQFNEEYVKLMTVIEQAKQNPLAMKQASNQTSNQAHPAFLDMLTRKLLDLNLADSEAANESVHCEIVKQLVAAYFKVTKNQMKDLVAKVVVRFLVDAFIGNLQEELTSHLHKEDRFEELFFECTDLSIKRKAAADMLGALTRAQKILSQYKSK